MTAPLLLLLALITRVPVIDQDFEIPANDWRFVPRPVTRRPAQMDCLFQSANSDDRVRVLLLDGTDLDAWRAGREHAEIDATRPGAQGSLRTAVHEPEAYVAIENRGPRPVKVHLRVFLEQPQVSYLSRGRRLAVILISVGVFVAIVTLSARRLLRAVRA
jgi:hypothetical protein